ncbi:MAG: hypothetical protein ABI910_04345 [Gemmatimonadota bacterium]
MTPRRPFLLRVDPALLEGVQRWANDELRSLNGQIEFLLRQALRDAGRLPKGDGTAGADPASDPNEEEESP